jgi:hypothetical protein
MAANHQRILGLSIAFARIRLKPFASLRLAPCKLLRMLAFMPAIGRKARNLAAAGWFPLR